MARTVALVAEIWYAEPVFLADPGVLAVLRQVSRDAQPQQESVVVPHETGSGGRPLLTVVTPGSPVGVAGKVRPDTSQTWDWPEAEAAAARGQASLLVSELFHGDSDRQTRLSAISRVVAALCRVGEPVAVSWPLSQRVCDPETVLPGDPHEVINIRMFSVSDDAIVLDTLGLYAFGLPEVQCHFRDREPGEIATLLFATGVYLFEAGDVIADGNTISGPGGEGRLVCRRESALLAPAREVLDVDLGAPYAAGDRGR
jgi:hypothetical protein